MRILLVVPTFHYKAPFQEGGGQALSLSDFPSGFAYLAASLKQAGHEVVGLNLNNIKGYPSPKLMLQDILTKKLTDVKPDLVGLGGLCTDYAFLKDAIAIVRANSTVPVVLGGQIVTNDADFIFHDLKPDYAIAGEADGAIVELADTLAQGQKLEPFIARATVIKDIDSLPLPDYEPFGVQDMLDNHSMDTRLLYRYPRPYPRPFNIVASRSCPFNCTFCVHGHRIPYRARSIESIMAEIKQTYEQYQFNILVLLDELFAVNKKRMIEFCQAVIEGKQKHGWDFDWMFQTHASARLDLETLRLAKQAGCFLFSYGLESASPAVLKSMNKRMKVEQVVEAMDMAKQAGIGFSANLIFGDVVETQETWAESLSFWLEHGQENFIFLANLMPYPGSKLFENIKVKNKRAYYERIDEGVVNMTTISDKSFEELIRLTSHLERAWLFVKPVLNPHCEREGVKMHKIWGTCPYCGVESMYRHEIGVFPFMMGTACIKCNRRMKIILTGVL